MDLLIEKSEVSISGFQNLESQYDFYSRDSLENRRNTVLAKVDQWSPLTGRIRINGLYQDRLGYNNNQLDALKIDDICKSLDLRLKKISIIICYHFLQIQNY